MTCCPTEVVNGSECYVTDSFEDVSGNPFTPTSIQYRVDDLTDDLNIVNWTTVAPAQSITITIQASQNVMQTGNTLIEQRQVLIKVGVPGGTTRTDVATYTLKNRFGTP